MGLRNVKFIASSMENLNGAVEEAAHIQGVDFVLSNLAFHHVKNKLLVIRNIYGILSYKGRLIVGDWFEPTRAYEKEIEKLRLKNPMLSKKFDESWQDFISDPSSREYSEEHPKEYPVSELELENIMKKAGFRKRKIIKMPMAIFAVVVGEK